MRSACLALLTLAAASAQAQVAPDREVEVVKSMFSAGNYKIALQRAQDAMGMTNFSEPQRVELHKYAGLSAFNLGDEAATERHFLQLLQLNPDYVLDPFAVSPPAIKAFEEVKRKNADALNLIRQNIALREEQARREAAERARQKALDEAEKARANERAKYVQVKTIEKHPFILNLVPFGAGQFIQGRNEWGIAFAVVETLLAATSLVAYIAIEAMFQDVQIPVQDAFDPNTGKFHTFYYDVRKIPPERANDHRVWNDVKLSTGIAFYAVAALGIADAIWHHHGEVVSVQNVPVDQADKPTLNLNLVPMPGGAAAGLTIHF